MPSAMTRKGRPRGLDMTVIGLPRKKCSGCKPISFMKMPSYSREKGKYVAKADIDNVLCQDLFMVIFEIYNYDLQYQTAAVIISFYIY